MNMVRQENDTLYVCKAFACLLVIFIHQMIPLPHGGDYILNLARCAVPFFFMVSGCFTVNASDEKLRGRIKKLAILFAAAAVGYFILNLVEFGRYDAAGEQLAGMAKPGNILQLIFLNRTTPYLGVGHLWYILALIYVYGLFMLLRRLGGMRLLPWIAALCLGAAFVTELLICYGGLGLGEAWYSNFLLTGLPCFAIGYGVGEYRDKLMPLFRRLGIPMLLLGAAALAAETYLWRDRMTLFASSVIFGLWMLLFSLRRPTLGSYLAPLRWYGKNCTESVYVIHYAFVIILSFNGVVLFWNYFIVLALSTAAAVVWYFVRQRLHR